ncbi:hypothetical protein JQ633_20055 [Bradyrhizobium tropiciagri]|uniref:hypothetical protein n=1 Tax=Bradyrhizobium tropiciagri TaxID=312253 RepID=UPI001BA8F813|nr:hypothetical protein [Bradyrhizobium tropiciagri]MBR0872667.1 hypothetical protein [Bradyrhizobium tropiciagri]
MALFDQMRKRDWAFVAVCVAGALFFGVWSVRLGINFHRAQGTDQSATDLSSSHRRARPLPAADAPAALNADDIEAQPGRPQ